MVYSPAMNKKCFTKVGTAGFVLGAALLATTTGCVGYVDRPHDHYTYSEPSYSGQDDYVYYPRYGMYYGSRSHQYYCQDGREWVMRPTPRGVSLDVLFASPSVRVDFHDGPARHHAQVVRTYPRHWTPHGGNYRR